VEIEAAKSPQFGLGPAEFRAGEASLWHWPSPEGRGLLTTQRCLLLGHPSPLHRAIRWSVELGDIAVLKVVRLPGRRGVWLGIRTPSGGGTFSTGRLDPEWCVVVDRTTVYVGYPQPCGMLQQRIDEARADRLMATVGHLTPYSGVLPPMDQSPFMEP